MTVLFSNEENICKEHLSCSTRVGFGVKTFRMILKKAILADIDCFDKDM